MDLVAAAGFALAAGFGGAWWLTRRLLRAGILPADHPNPRSSHTVPTPRGGGLGSVFGFSLASLGLGLAGLVPGWVGLAVVGGGLGVAGIGLLDDLSHVAIPWRLLVHAGAAAWGLVWLGCPWGVGVAAGLALVWLVNLYNFMDGIDGLAAVEALGVALGAAVILWSGGQAELAVWLLSLAAAAGGFLVWNWPPARVFMGDAGSGFFGFVLGMLALVTSGSGGIGLWSWVILLAVFVTDATCTLLRRMARGQRWWEAHRTHAYQHLAGRCGHLAVTVGVAAVNGLWLLPLAWAAARHPGLGGWLAAVAYGPLIWIAVCAGSGLEPVRPAEGGGGARGK